MINSEINNYVRRTKAKTFLPLELDEELVNEQIVTSYVCDRETTTTLDDPRLLLDNQGEGYAIGDASTIGAPVIGVSSSSTSYAKGPASSEGKIPIQAAILVWV